MCRKSLNAHQEHSQRLRVGDDTGAQVITSGQGSWQQSWGINHHPVFRGTHLCMLGCDGSGFSGRSNTSRVSCSTDM
jgi:hypothetical protein